MKKSAKEQPNKLAKKVVRDNENGARRAILEDLFFDFHKSSPPGLLGEFCSRNFLWPWKCFGCDVIDRDIDLDFGAICRHFPAVG